MLSRLRSGIIPFLDYLFALEAALVGLFFIQAVRFLIGGLYAHVASASLFPALDPRLINPNLPGLIEPSQVSTELTVVSFMILLPLLSLLIGHFTIFLVASALLTAAGRYLMAGNEDIIPAALVLGGGLLYIAMLVRHRVHLLPYLFIIGFTVDQYLRAVGDTRDPSLFAVNETAVIIVSVLLALLALINFLVERRRRVTSPDAARTGQGLMTFWGGIGMGALLFLQLSLLTLPGAILGRSGLDYADYIWVAPALVAATALPLIPAIQGMARNFIGTFDSAVRGWSWMMLVMLLIVIGLRLGGIVGGLSLIVAQFLISMLWWWLARPKAATERSFSGFWIVAGVLLFALLTVMDIFTYEYAYVREFAGDFAFLNSFVPALLRGFRGMGIAVLLLAVFFAALPMTQMRRRIPWRGGAAVYSLLAAVVFVVLGAGATYLAVQPPVVTTSADAEFRVVTYNIHAGYNEYFHYNLDEIASAVGQAGPRVLLLQEVEVGRMTSFGVDQVLWLARKLEMDARFYPTNEGIQGLAVLSKVPIVFDDGVQIESVGSQTGLQRVQILPDEGVITIYNTWLDPLLDVGAGQTTQDVERSQQSQLGQIFGVIREHHPDGFFGRMIIGGTFNNVPDSDVIQRMKNNGFIDYFEGRPLETSATFWRTGQRARLDYLWAAPAIEINGSNVIDSNASDHRPVVIRLDLG